VVNRQYHYVDTSIDNLVDATGTTQSVGRELERLRKLRGLTREDVAAQLPQPVSPSTIRNIEHDDSYNVPLQLLRQIAFVLGAEVRVDILAPDPGGSRRVTERSGQLDAFARGDERCVMDNDYFIRRIRDRYPDCVLSNSQIGRRMWTFAKSRGAELIRERKQVRTPVEHFEPRAQRFPTTTAEFAVPFSEIQALEKFADRLGRAFRDQRGQTLVPLV
jgi:transcriptional regulator with XRE-family HTH domain